MENLTISLPEGTNMEPIGIISSIVDQLGNLAEIQLSKSHIRDKTDPAIAVVIK